MSEPQTEAYQALTSTGVGASATIAGGPLSATRFTMVKEHARGGLGKVSLAHDLRLKRPVAIKEIRPDRIGNAELRERFLTEAEITSQLQHPGIVPIYGLEEDAAGQPYYAMRFVEGKTLAEASRAFHKNGCALDFFSLEFRELLGRFISICQTIAYAHAKGLIHRDLKPANVVLGDYGETLVLDWGLAKRVGATERPATAESEALARTSTSTAVDPLTEAGQVLGTANYMSPEQARGEEVSPATDVYALGAILFEMLTGRPPFAGQPAQEVLHKVRAGSAPGDVPPNAPKALIAIYQKAMARQSHDRHASATLLATDVQHWLADEPVACHAEPWPVKARRWSRKHRTLVTSAAAVLTLAALGSVAGFIAVSGFNQKLDAANTQLTVKNDALETSIASEKTAKKRAENTLDFFVTSLRRPDPAMDGKKLTVYELLGKTVKDLEADLTLDAVSRCALLNAIGETYVGLGEHAEAISVLESAVDLANQRLEPGDHDRLTSQNTLALAYQRDGKLDRAIPLFERTLKEAEVTLGDEDHRTLTVRNNLAVAYQALDRLDLAIPLLERIVKDREHRLGNEHADTLVSLNNLANAYEGRGMLDKAIPIHERNADWCEARLGRDHPTTLTVRINLADAYRKAGKLNLAVQLLEPIVKDCEAKLGDDHPATLTARNNLAIVYRRLKKFELAIELHQRTVVAEEATLGPDHPSTLSSRNNLALAYREAGRLDLAIPTFERALEGFVAKFGNDHIETLTCRDNLAKAYLEAQRPADAQKHLEALLAGERKRSAARPAAFAAQLAKTATDLLKANQWAAAETFLREALAVRESHEPNAWTTFNTKSMLGAALLGRVRSASKDEPAEVLREAEQLLLQGYEGMKQRVDKMPPQVKDQRLREAVERLLQLYETLSKSDEAARWRKELETLKPRESKP